MMRKAAEAICDFYIDNTPVDGIPYWDTGAPGLEKWVTGEPKLPILLIVMRSYEPVDSSAAAIAAQGLLRLGRYLKNDRYWQAGLSVCRSLLAEPYLSADAEHQGLILHAVYHRPNGWGVSTGESCMWGDYHAIELALYVQRVAQGQTYYKFWSDPQ